MYPTFIQLVLVNEKGILLTKPQIQQVTVKEFEKESINVYVLLNHFAVHLKLTQYC